MEENKTAEVIDNAEDNIALEVKAEAIKAVANAGMLADESKIMDISADEFREILADLRKTNQEQADYAKRAWIMSLISTIAVLIVALFILLYGAFLIPKINALLNEAQISLNNVSEITDEISKVDFEGLIGDVGGLVTTTQEDLGKTMDKIEELNIEDLNKGIKNLSNVIEPLANFFGVLGGQTESLSKVNVGNKVESTIDGIGDGIEDSVGTIGKSIGSGIEKGIENTISNTIGSIGKTKNNKAKK